MAWRNLVRHTRRTVLTVSVIVVATGVLILGQGFIAGLDENVIVAAEDGLVGHVLARPADYPTAGLQHPIDELIELSPAARELLDAETAAWTARLMFMPTAVAGSDSLRVRGIGYDPAQDPKVFRRDTWTVDGRQPTDGADEVLVSRGVARLLRLGVGQTVVLQVRTHRGAINALALTVTGIVSTTNAALDALTVFVPRQTVVRLAGTDRPSHVGVRLARREAAPAFAPRLAAALGPTAEVVTLQDETRELLELQNIRRKALNMFVFVLMLLAAFGIANTILMAAYERVRELGTLRALGMPGTGVIGLFLGEGLLMGIVGSALGALWSTALVAYWSENPIDLTEAMQNSMNNAIPVSTFLYARLESWVVVAAVTLGVGVAGLASIYPARVAAAMSPADAVRAD